MHYRNQAESLSTQKSAWLLVPETAGENKYFKDLLRNHNLLWDFGAALGLREKNGKFVDRNDQERLYYFYLWSIYTRLYTRYFTFYEISKQQLGAVRTS